MAKRKNDAALEEEQKKIEAVVAQNKKPFKQSEAFLRNLPKYRRFMSWVMW